MAARTPVGRVIWHERDRLGWSQKKLGEKARPHHPIMGSVISNIERGHTKHGQEQTLSDLVRAFGWTLSQLFERAEQEAGRNDSAEEPRQRPAEPLPSQDNVLLFQARTDPAYHVLYEGPPTWRMVDAHYGEWWDGALPADQLIGSTPADYWPADKLPEFQAVLQKAWSGERVEIYYTLHYEGQPHYRRSTFFRQGDYIASDVWEVPAPAAHIQSVATFDVTESMEKVRRQTKVDQ